ncbi:hypothetical protein NSND_10008 [Nitrospira sp. ND1]|nr:hypothetical protein NSND_10008 [Nitrospira sp. ND1]
MQPWRCAGACAADPVRGRPAGSLREGAILHGDCPRLLLADDAMQRGRSPGEGRRGAITFRSADCLRLGMRDRE